jgi:hypothetical protein
MVPWSKPHRSLQALLSGLPLRDLDFGEKGERSPVRNVELLGAP